MISLKRALPLRWLIGMALWLLIPLCLAPMGIPDEARYSEVAREMAASLDFLTPSLNGLPYFHKPPLFYWLGSLSIRLFGVHLWATRLPVWAVSVSTLAYAYLYTRRFHGFKVASIFLATALTQPLTFVLSSYANHDAMVACFINLAVLMGAQCILEGPASQRRLLGFYLCLALGLLSKGLVGLVFPCAILFLWKGFRAVRILANIQGIMLFMLLALPWFTLNEIRYPGFLNYFFLKHHVARFLAHHFNGQQPFWFCVAVFFAGAFPSTLLLFFYRMQHFQGLKNPTLLRLYLISIIFTLFFFSIPASKLIGYIMPSMLPFALFTACLLEAWPVTQLRLFFIASGSFLLLTFAVYATHVNKALASLATSIPNPSEAHVIFFEDYHYSLPFLMNLREPATVLSSWSQPEIRQQDDWKTELAEASDFDQHRGARILREAYNIPVEGCQRTNPWIITSDAIARKVPELNSLAIHSRQGDWLALDLQSYCQQLRP